MTRPLFVSFEGTRKGTPSKGWVVLPDVSPLTTPEHIGDLCRFLELSRGYDDGSVMLNSFQRLESPE